MPSIELSREEAIEVLTRRATRAWVKKHKNLVWFGLTWFVVMGGVALFLGFQFEHALEAMTFWGRLVLYVPVFVVMFCPIVAFVLIDSRHATQAKREVE